MMRIDRRSFLAALGGGVATLSLGSLGKAASADTVFPNSSGSERPALRTYPFACDSHLHIIDARFSPAEPGATLLSNATAADYRRIQARIGTSRVVAVQSKLFGTDNSCLIDAVRQLAPARGIAVVHPDVTEPELRFYSENNIQGFRISTINPADKITSLDMIEPLAAIAAKFDWHLQLYMSGEQIVDNEAMLARLPCPIVFDHLGKIPPSAGTAHPAFGAILRLIKNGRTWVKLAGAYINTQLGPPAYADATAVARAFVSAAPHRLVWGSDWPHTTETQKPDDALLFDLLQTWISDPKDRHRIWVENPTKLYKFDQPS
jgi:predicted TIM-barrel fold metal-dependent hydrolase